MVDGDGDGDGGLLELKLVGRGGEGRVVDWVVSSVHY